MLNKQVKSLSRTLLKNKAMKLLYYKFQQLTLLQIAMDSYYKLLQLFLYKGLLWQDFTKCDVSITDCVAYRAR